MTAYSALAGRPPFRAESIGELVTQVLARDPEPLDRVRPDTPAQLTAVVARLMAKDRATRYASARELVADLEQIRVDEVS